ncbi:hypothetical protein APS60_11375 [Cutibacterium acnes]|uniref:Uncharacterized protein n=1 Tax=Cutibacterium acnes TaxID=1747 RepID=A0AA44U329_CUTAC|nr:hypothetical protein APS59_11940 [Cutibacterium acnes]PGF30307.1 hypothetical protein B1B02_03960 [Cutibacterium acnes subsp. defendens]PGF31144.1 hypothetical protein B1B08_03950 [Cutibacterium acnes subsp. defendens]PGF41601.1 hypothetical protein B1B14_03920 [Cutibacterium acnes subsp. defendens]PGF45390.1 hypothetical protein B1B12_08385 [Cutibacterium acnes subsp. defendens]
MGVTPPVMRATMPRRTALSALPYFDPRLMMRTLTSICNRHIPRIFHVRDTNTLLSKSRRGHEADINHNNP